MDEKNEEIKQRLDRLVAEIQSIYEVLESSGPAMPLDAVENLRNSVCLRCKKPITKKQRTAAARGNHSGCYRNNLRAIERKEETDESLITKGLWAPKNKGGRPRVDPAE